MLHLPTKLWQVVFEQLYVHDVHIFVSQLTADEIRYATFSAYNLSAENGEYVSVEQSQNLCSS
jgi:hypothetical protein